MKNFLSRTDLAIWLAMIAGKVVLCFCVLKKTVLVSRVRGRLRLKSVLPAATCGTENAREGEEYFVRDFDGGVGSGVRNGQSVRRSGAYLSAQPGLSDFWPAKRPYLPTRQAMRG
jgi:hypothetical protein